MPHIDGGGEDIEDRSEIIEGNGERGAIGDVTQDGGLGVRDAQRQVSRPDIDCRGRELLSVSEAGMATPNQLNHFAINSND